MKAQTRIEAAVKACYDAYADYARKVDNMPVIPSFPKVRWERGSLKNSNTGWWVDGRLYNGTAEEVIAHWDKQTLKWVARLRKKMGETPSQQPDMPGTEALAYGSEYTVDYAVSQ